MRFDSNYTGIRYNLISNRAEVTTLEADGTQAVHDWDDADDSTSRNYIEERYKLYSPQKHTDALRILFREREYNPIKDLVETFHWDGVPRCRSFLTKWLHADDSAYTKEVSRLIFAGGINRLYNPGCKFDDVPVLIGTKQGEGKSTIIKWLALNEVWFAEIKRVEGQDSIEAMFGAWICEIPELSAFKKADDVESIKAFVTRTKDKYRKPYDRNPVDYPRRCIFIGTTNNEQFLADKTGNRRFYPVKTSSVGYDLFDHEEEIKEYIRQCWAEARELYKDGKMPPFADRSLLDEYRRRQDAAMEDDWRVGKIEAFLSSMGAGEIVCVLELYTECLYRDTNQKPKLSESRAIGQIMARMEDWESIGSYRTSKYGKQKCWRKKKDSAAAPLSSVDDPNQLPF
jgi:predicted P-loop ATPase